MMLEPINKLAALGVNRGDYFEGLQSVSPLPYYKFRALAKSKNYRERTPGMTHSERMDLLAVELGAKSFRQYRDTMVYLGVWKEKNGAQRLARKMPDATERGE